MENTQIKPALSAEEWAKYLAAPLEVDLDDFETDHGTAAVCLYGQPFGFTREDVRDLQTVLDEPYDGMPFAYWVGAETAERIEHLRQRIEALLPPE